MKRWFGEIEPVEALVALAVSVICAAYIVWNPEFKALLYWWLS